MTSYQQRMLQWGRVLLALLLSALLTMALASMAHSLFVQAGLIAVGAEIPFLTRINAMLRDFVGLLPGFGPVLLLALAIGFAVARLVKPYLPLLAPFAYPLAGWAAVAVALYFMRFSFGLTPIAGARTTAGFLSITLAGLAGGLLFTWLQPRRS